MEDAGLSPQERREKRLEAARERARLPRDELLATANLGDYVRGPGRGNGNGNAQEEELEAEVFHTMPGYREVIKVIEEGVEIDSDEPVRVRRDRSGRGLSASQNLDTELSCA